MSPVLSIYSHRPTPPHTHQSLQLLARAWHVEVHWTQRRKAGRKLTSCEWLKLASSLQLQTLVPGSHMLLPELKRCFPSFTFQRHFLDSQVLGLAQVWKNKKATSKQKRAKSKTTEVCVPDPQTLWQRLCHLFLTLIPLQGPQRKVTFPSFPCCQVGVTWLVLANEMWAEEMSVITSGLSQWRASVPSPSLFSKVTLEPTGLEWWFTNCNVHTNHLGVLLNVAPAAGRGGEDLKFFISNKQLNGVAVSAHTFEEGRVVWEMQLQDGEYLPNFTGPFEPKLDLCWVKPLRSGSSLWPQHSLMYPSSNTGIGSCHLASQPIFLEFPP